jgi:broad specificity phosphatase PhoE
MSTNQPCTIYLVRHGQSVANIQEFFGLDTELTDEGKKQARLLANVLKDIYFDAIFSSNLIRAKQTAEIISLGRKLAIQTKNLLREHHLGSLEGKNKAEVRESFKDLFEIAKTMHVNDRVKYKIVPDMETEEEAVSRYVTVLREIAKAYAGKNVLVVSHQGVMRFFLTHIGYVAYNELAEGSISNLGYVKLQSNGVDFKVIDTQGIIKKDS